MAYYSRRSLNDQILRCSPICYFQSYEKKRPPRRPHAGDMGGDPNPSRLSSFPPSLQPRRRRSRPPAWPCSLPGGRRRGSSSRWKLRRSGTSSCPRARRGRWGRWWRRRLQRLSGAASSLRRPDPAVQRPDSRGSPAGRAWAGAGRRWRRLLSKTPRIRGYDARGGGCVAQGRVSSSSSRLVAACAVAGLRGVPSCEPRGAQ